MFARGKLPKKTDVRTLKFSRYAANLPLLPPSTDWQSAVPSYPMDGNDSVGDCTIAGAAHLVETWSFNEKPPSNINFSTQDCLSNYYALTGGPDNGLALLDVLRQWQGAGLKYGTRKDVITAYAELSAGDKNQIQQAVALFGGAYIGLELPSFVIGNTSVWEVPPGGAVGPNAPNPNEGHCVCIVGYDADWLYVVTWGAVVKMSYDFYAAYSDEAYAILSADWLGAGVSPEGFDLQALQADLAQVEAETPQPLPPTPQPVPPSPTIVEIVVEDLTNLIKEIEKEL